MREVNAEGRLAKLTQCHLTLQSNLDILKWLDEEILALVLEEELDSEIEQADIF